MPIKPFIIAGVLAGLVLAACGDEEEAPDPQQTATPTATAATATATATATPTVTPTVTPPPPSPSPAASPEGSGPAGGGDLGPGTPVPVAPVPAEAEVPDDWNTFESTAPVYIAFRYPAGWYRERNRVMSFDPATWSGPYFPAGQIGVEVIQARAESAQPRPKGAEDITLAGRTGWQQAYSYPDAVKIGGVGLYHTVAIPVGEYVVFITAVYGAVELPDDPFPTILASLKLAEGGSP
jgi:hypothetical protein